MKLLEKVINRSTIQSVLEEVFNRKITLVALEEKEWLTIKESYRGTMKK